MNTATERKLYHVSAFLAYNSEKTIWHDDMYLISTPNLSEGWLPFLRETIRDAICKDKQIAPVPPENVTIISISPLS
jgi:hypothetical protein